MTNPRGGHEASPSIASRNLLIEAVVVPLDGSDQGLRALRVAETVANSLGCLVTTISFAPSVAAQRFESRVRRLVRGALKSTPHSVMVRAAGLSIADDIRLELALQPGALLCMPTLGEGLSGGSAGSVAKKVLGELPRPILLVGPKCDGADFDPTQPLLVAADSSGPAQDALQVAQAWRLAFGSDDEQTTTFGPSLSPENIAKRLASDAGAMSSSAIVVARHAQGTAVINGALATEVTQFARCPVLVHA